jgi:hypothetical protein
LEDVCLLPLLLICFRDSDVFRDGLEFAMVCESPFVGYGVAKRHLLLGEVGVLLIFVHHSRFGLEGTSVIFCRYEVLLSV